MGGRLTGLDALRGIAAMAVMLFCHEFYLIGSRGHRPIMNSDVYELITFPAAFAVDLFFVISGFVFAHVYQSESGLKVPAARFVQARLARLYPLHLLMLLLTAWLLSAGMPLVAPIVPPDAKHFVLNLLMSQGIGPQDGWNFNAPAWSISVEVICYLIFVSIRRSRLYVPAAAALILVGLVLCAAPLNSNVGRGLVGFFAGSLLYRSQMSRALCFALLFTSLPLMALPKPFSFGAFSLTGGIALVALAKGWSPSRLLVWLGDRSFSIYLIHVPVFWAFSMLVFGNRFVPGIYAGAAFAVAIPTVLLLSDLSYRFYETPARRWINSYSPNRMKPFFRSTERQRS